MTQPPTPLAPVKARARARSLSRSSVSPSRGGACHDHEMPDADTKRHITHADGLPSTKHIVVRTTGTAPHLFALLPFKTGEAIYNTTDDHVFHPFTRTAPQGNARRIVDPDTNTAHFIASKPISVNDEIIITHRSIIVRTAAVDDDQETEHKYADIDDSISAPLTPVDSATKLLAELERRGKTSPATEQEKLQLIDAEHQRGHFGRDSIYRTLYRNGHW
jgi:hypothetical protein